MLTAADNARRADFAMTAVSSSSGRLPHCPSSLVSNASAEDVPSSNASGTSLSGIGKRPLPLLRKLKNTSTITAILTTPAFAGLTNAATVLGVPAAMILSAQTSELPASQQRLNV